MNILKSVLELNRMSFLMYVFVWPQLIMPLYVSLCFYLCIGMYSSHNNYVSVNLSS